MTALRQDGRAVVIDFDRGEAGLIGRLVAQLRELIESDDHDDEALGRLFPDAYPDDGLASAEFRRLTGEDLREGKLGNLALVAEMVGGDSLESVPTTIVLDTATGERWLRVLTDLRLTVGERIGLRGDEDEPDGHELGPLYQWLSQLQWGIVDALDAIDLANGAAE